MADRTKEGTGSLTPETRTQGYRRYKAYLRHANKHDLLEKYITNLFNEQRGASKVLSVLDIGAGSGRLTRAVVEAATRNGLLLRLVAVEPCREAVEEMRSALSCSINHGQTIEIVEGSFDEIIRRPFDGFDLVLASHVSYYFADIEKFVAEVMGLLNRDGKAIFVATSTTIMQNDLYQTLFRTLRRDATLPRTFSSDGYLSFAENLEIALIAENAAYSRTSLKSAVTFCPEEIRESIRAIENGGNGSILEAMSFLWRYPVSALLSIRDDWLDLFHNYRELDAPLSLYYEDLVLQASR